MAFTVFTDATLADANEIMENFYWIAKDTRLPRGGTNLDPTNGAYDIGSATYPWETVFCSTLDYSGTLSSDNMWLLVSDITLSTSTDRVEFTGLNGAIDDIYRIIISGKTEFLYYYLNLNGASSVSYSYRSYSTDYNSFGFVDSSGGDSNIRLNGYGPESHVDILIIPDAGYGKTVKAEYQNNNAISSGVGEFYHGMLGAYANLTATLTSIQISSTTITASTNIKLFRAKNV